MSPGKTPGRRAMLAGAAIAAIPSAALASDMAAAFTPVALDARLVTLAGNLRQAEADYSALVCRNDADRDDAAEEAASLRITSLAGAMAALPAAGLQGIAAKAGRLCWSLSSGTGLDIMLCDEPLAESLAADLARLVPHAVGVNA